MATLRKIDLFATAYESLNQGIVDLDIHQIGGRTMLYAATRAGGGISAWQIDDGAILRDHALDGEAITLSAPARIDRVTIDGTDMLIRHGAFEAGLRGFELGATGQLDAAVSLGTPSGARFANLQTVETGAGMIAVTTDAFSAGLTTWSVGAGGALTRTGELSLGIEVPGLDTPDMAQVDLGGQTILLALSRGANSIASFRVGADGSVAPVDTVGAAAGQLPISVPMAVETVSVAGGTYAVVSGFESKSLSVLRIAADGGLTAVDHVVDDLNTRFGGATALAAVEAGGRAFVLAGGADDGLSLLEVMPGGRLLHRATVADALDTTLDNVSAIAARATASGLDIFVASQTETGITRFTVDLPGADGPVIGTAGADSLFADAGGQFLDGGAGDDTLRGGSGDDVLRDGAGFDSLFGGAGADTFVLSADDQKDWIWEFEIGTDRLDLSEWAGLRDTAQLTMDATRSGATISYGDERLVLRSVDGTRIEAADLRASAFIDLAHFVPPVLTSIPGTVGNDILTGTDGSDDITALGGMDTIDGGAGGDLIDGGEGRDLLRGGEGDDSVRGGGWADTLIGGAGQDTLQGGDAADMIEGGTGNDLLEGGDGPDTLRGDAGADTLRGGAWSDRLEGNDGHDRLEGGQGNDTLDGGLLDDTILGGDGQDVIHGRGGHDRILGEAGADRVWAGSGNDLVDGGSWSDVLHGEAGDDTILGGDGTDQLFGGTGDDILRGGTGQDMIRGGDGADRIAGDTWSDALYGDGGRDTLEGGSGDDLLDGGAEADHLVGGTGFDRLLGGAGDDRLEGGDQRDRLDGGDGNDWLDGGTWNDMLFGDAGDDRLIGGAGEDGLSGDLGHDWLQGGVGRDTLYGGGGDDLLDGDSWADVLFGGFGADTLRGGAGNDALTGSGGADSFVFENGHDRICDYEDGLDRILFAPELFDGIRPDRARLDAMARVDQGDLLLAFDSVNSLRIEDRTTLDGLTWDLGLA